MKRFFVAAAVALAGLAGFSSCDKKGDTEIVVPKVTFFSDEALHKETKELTNPVWVVVKVDAATKLDESATVVMAVNGNQKKDLKNEVKWKKGNVDHEYKAVVKFPTELYKAGAVLKVSARDKKNGITDVELKFKGNAAATAETFGPKKGSGVLGSRVGKNGAYCFDEMKEVKITDKKWTIANVSGKDEGIGDQFCSDEVTISGTKYECKNGKDKAWKFVEVTGKNEKALEAMTQKDAMELWKKGGKTNGLKMAGKVYLTCKGTGVKGDRFYIIKFAPKVTENADKKQESISFDYYSLECK